jgi:hypothetical protein
MLQRHDHGLPRQVPGFTANSAARSVTNSPTLGSLSDPGHAGGQNWPLEKFLPKPTIFRRLIRLQQHGYAATRPLCP